MVKNLEPLAEELPEIDFSEKEEKEVEQLIKRKDCYSIGCFSCDAGSGCYSCVSCYSTN